MHFAVAYSLAKHSMNVLFAKGSSAMNASVRHKYVSCAAAGTIEAAALAIRLGSEFRTNSELEHHVNWAAPTSTVPQQQAGQQQTASVKSEVGIWKICQDAQGELYWNSQTLQMHASEDTDSNLGSDGLLWQR